MGGLIDILTKKYIVEDLIDLVDKCAHPITGPDPIADSPTMLLAVLSLAQQV